MTRQEMYDYLRQKLAYYEALLIIQYNGNINKLNKLKKAIQKAIDEKRKNEAQSK
ncbi:hypothetical protein ACFL40_04400 [candidate division KSB1 bacterium]